MQLETRVNTDASWVDIVVDVPPDLLRIFITISALVSDITPSRHVHTHTCSILRYVLKPVEVTPVTAYASVAGVEIHQVGKPVKTMLTPLHART